MGQGLHVLPGRALRETPNARSRRKSPSSLLARANLVLGISASAIALTSIIASAVFVILPIEDRSADDEAGLIVLSAKTWVELDAARRPAFELEMLQNHDLIVSAETRDLPYVEAGNRYYDLLASKLGDRIDGPVRLMESDDLLWANVPMGGYLMQVGISPQRQDIEPVYVGFVIVLFGAVIVPVTSGLIVRRVAQPLTRAAQAVDAFRGAEGFQPLPEEGPEELVTLAASFNAMARNVSELLSNRAGEAQSQVDFPEYLKAVLRDIDEEIDIEWRRLPPPLVEIATGAFQRVVANLVRNARQHGSGARLAVDYDGDLILHVIDDGPGIPPKDREKVFQPFYRLEGSRSRATGGSGLGLAIVAQLCEAHGWQIGLHSSNTGGTDAQVRLPLSAAQREERNKMTRSHALGEIKP